MENKPPDKKTPKKAPSVPPQWQTLLWYLPFMLLLLWFWQDAWSNMVVKTIPYSQFKQYVARGEVTECLITENAIEGRIVPKKKSSESQAQASTPPANNKKKPAADKGKTPPASQPLKATVSEKKEQKKAASAKQPPGTSSQQTGKQGEKTKVKTPTGPFNFRTVRVEDPQLVGQLEAAGVKFTGVRPGFLSRVLLAWVIPLGLLMLIWFVVFRRLGSAGQGVLSIGKSKAKLIADRDTGVTFDDVAGCDEAKVELQEVIDFLKNPDHYSKLGAQIPKGALLLGPPGTGKTLLARAIAGEAKVPFFSLSGSDFVEMFVGVGAARVRDLFNQASKNAPCIVFIDELDAIGRQRGVHVGAVNDEREQTLNQLLVEMDGFEPNTGVILIAATNRPEVLDRALLRPGRFDRQIVVDSPDVGGREAILKIHSRDKPLSDDVDLRQIALATPGMSGADLANVMNEAALLAARRRSKTISHHDVEEAVEKIVAGPERRSRRLDDQEKRRVAFHEVGHALVATFSEHADPVHKISIVPRGRAALGYTLQLPDEQQFLMTREELIDRIKGLLGGRAAEQTVFGEVSTGAQNDLERATTLARQMVCMYGMSEAIGLMHCASQQPEFLVSDGAAKLDCSDETAREVDKEVQRILADTFLQAMAILKEHREQLETVVQELLEHETLDRADFERLIGASSEPSSPPRAAATTG